MLQLVPASWKPEVNDFIEISVKGFMTQEYRIEDLLYINPEFLLHDQEMILKSIFGFDIKWILKYLKETYKEDRYYIIGCRSVVRISSPIIVGEDHGIQPTTISTAATTGLPKRNPRIYSKTARG
jgi:hypothetical protein